MVDGLHVLVQRRPSVERGRADRAPEDHLADLHDVGRGGAVLFRVSVRDVLEEGVGVVEVDVAVVAVVVGPAAATSHDGLPVLLLQLKRLVES